MDEEELLTIGELCKWLKIGRVTAWRWREKGMPHIKLGNRVRYDKAEVLKWLKENGKE